MDTQTTRDNQALLEFWDRFFAIPEEEKEAARREGVGEWKELAPSEKLLRAVCELGGRKKVLDYGCGNGWAAIAAAKSGCPEVTAADPAPHAAEAADFLAGLFGVSEQVRPVCCGGDWLKSVPDETYDGLICSNVLDVIPAETAEEMSTDVLALKKIHKDFGAFHALTDVDLTVEKGKIYGFIGKNGAGKTTMMRIISGMSLPTSGSMELFGKSDPREVCRERARLGVMLEDRGISPELTAEQNLKAQMLLKGLHDDSRIREVLEIVGLTNTGPKKFKEFSLGMKRRLTLAATLLSKPEFLILDEPTNGLDPVGIKDIRDLLLRINREHGTTILISSHILRELYEVATDFIFIDGGEIIGEISKEQLDRRLESKIIIRSKETGIILDALRRQGLDAGLTVSGDTITLSGSGVDEEALCALLHESGAVLLELTQKRETLESYFIGLIGGEHHG